MLIIISTPTSTRVKKAVKDESRRSRGGARGGRRRHFADDEHDVDDGANDDDGYDHEHGYAHEWD